MPPGRRAAADGPSPETLEWVTRALDGDDVVDVRRLTGGIATATHLLRLASGRQVVLRRHHEEWVREDPAIAAGEVEVLRHVRARGLHLAPEVLAADVAGAATGGRPAILLARLPGRIDLAPVDRPQWLRRMAEALADVHAQPPPPSVTKVGPSAPPPWMRRVDRPPPWSVHPELWDRALELVWERPAPEGARAEPVLVHGDYQHYNLLWSRGRLTGVVDWSPPHDRPLDSDLGHCRLNLVILYGTEAADDFLRAYGAATGGRTIDPWWDLLETVMFLPTWADTIRRQVGSRIPFDADAMHRRVDDHLPSLLRPFSGINRRSTGRRASSADRGS